MVELTVGSRFWYKDKLYEVCKGHCLDNKCLYRLKECDGNKKCHRDDRHDGNFVYFKEVKE